MSVFEDGLLIKLLFFAFWTIWWRLVLEETLKAAGASREKLLE
jgi:hypothetical protein